MRHTRIQVGYGAQILHFSPFTGTKVRFWGALTELFFVSSILRKRAVMKFALKIICLPLVTATG